MVVEVSFIASLQAITRHPLDTVKFVRYANVQLDLLIVGGLYVFLVIMEVELVGLPIII